MVLQADPSGLPRLIGNNTSEVIQLSPGQLTNLSLGAWALGGDDTVNGSGNSEFILGNEGEDILTGFAGNDSLFGGKARDFLSGSDGNDCLSGGLDADFLLGDAGDDILFGGRGNDLMGGGFGDNTLIGGLGRDFYNCENGTHLCVLDGDSAAGDINSADAIVNFVPGFDRIGLAGGLTVNDIVLEPVQNVPLAINFEAPQFLQPFLPPAFINGFTGSTSGTQIRARNSGAILGYVANVTPSELQNSIISVQGF